MQQRRIAPRRKKSGRLREGRPAGTPPLIFLHRFPQTLKIQQKHFSRKNHKNGIKKPKKLRASVSG